MLIYGQVKAVPYQNTKITEYVVPQNMYVDLESVWVWTSSDGRFTIYKNGIPIGDVCLSSFKPTFQLFVGDSLRPLDVISAYGYHGQNTDQDLGCTIVLKQL